MAAPRPSAMRQDVPCGARQALVPAWECHCAKCGYVWISVAGPAIRDTEPPTWSDAPRYCGRCGQPNYDAVRPRGRPRGPRSAAA